MAIATRREVVSHDVVGPSTRITFDDGGPLALATQFGRRVVDGKTCEYVSMDVIPQAWADEDRAHTRAHRLTAANR